ncbi:hypothetical protein [Marinomonas ostreistagni]|uniref:DUF930 domain-containing protein n=1 Tax=Marinomonas ostreistagni TaxID=359209 RepID=A0ABS0Z6Q2_9GAMM|nr:hypothetical protein [Marinomonas ostreistagni]MBJ7549332.1 hypothetical protein [Marinomonas ostreistagni]
MKRLLKPWVFALLAALSLHAVVFVWLEDGPWHLALPKLTPPHYLEVSLLASDAPTPDELYVNNDKQAPAPQKATESDNLFPKSVVENVEPSPAPAKQPNNQAISTSGSSQTTKEMSSETQEISMKDKPISLQDIYEVTESELFSEQDWKTNSLLDIGPVEASRPAVDPSKDAFSPKFRQAIRQAKRVQEEYSKGIVEETEYPITEDADGTKYVNIKGLCWKMPEPGSMDAWQIVLSGCSGQKEVFRFELNITTDILRSDVFQDLPFGPIE